MVVEGATHPLVKQNSRTRPNLYVNASVINGSINGDPVGPRTATVQYLVNQHDIKEDTLHRKSNKILEMIKSEIKSNNQTSQSSLPKLPIYLVESCHMDNSNSTTNQR